MENQGTAFELPEFEKFAWVTVLYREQDLIPACILARSLKREQTVHQCVAIVLSGNDSVNKCSELLTKSWFGLNQVITVDLGATKSESVSVEEILNLPEVVDKLSGYKSYALLPPDTVASTNPDYLFKQLGQNDTLSDQKNASNVLVKNLKTFLLISETDERRKIAEIDTLINTLSFNDLNTNENCLDHLPLFIRLPGVTPENVEAALDSTSGLYEMGILKFWREHHNAVTNFVKWYDNCVKSTGFPDGSTIVNLPCSEKVC